MWINKYIFIYIDVLSWRTVTLNQSINLSSAQAEKQKCRIFIQIITTRVVYSEIFNLEPST